MLVTPVNKVISITNKEGAKMKKTTQTARKKALKRVTTLVDSGASLTNARIIVAGELGIAPTTLAKWEHTMNKTTKPVKIVKVDEYNNVHEMARDTGIVLKSLVNQDGRFTTKEASAISGLFNGHISLVKLRLEASKVNTRTSTDITKEVLTLQ